MCVVICFADVECDDDSIEIPYYSAGNTPICHFCASEENFKEQTDSYPICMSCYCSGNRSPAKQTYQFKPKD